MMCKKLIIASVCFLLFLLAPTIAYGAQAKSVEADIVILYENPTSAADLKNIETMVKLLTYQNYAVAYGTLEEYKGSIDKYQHVICYDLDVLDKAGMKELTNENSNVMMIGNNIIESYVNAKKLSVETTKSISKSARVTYKFSEQQAFTSLIEVDNPYILKGDITYQSGTYDLNGTLQGFCIGNDQFRYIPTIDLEDSLVQAIFTNEVAKWMWPYNGEPHTYAQYMVFDEVYPFTNLEQMMSVIDTMIELKTPYIISVMPIYQNGEFPSMKRFCEVLKYAQANGGAIVLHAPIVQTTNLNVDEIREYMTTATEAYTNYGVYPMGIEAPSNWLFDEQGQEILKRYRTVFIYDEENKESSFNKREHFNTIYKDGHQIIGPAISLDDSGGSKLKAYSAAVYMNILEDIEILKNKIQGYKESIIPIKSLWDFSNVVYTDTLVLEYNNNSLTLNGEQVSLDYTPFVYEKNYQFKRDIMSRITVDLANQNKKLISAVFITLLLFISFIIIARKANKKKFFYPKEK